MNLISASLWRMRKSKAFLLALLAMLAYTALVVMVCWDHYEAMTYNYTMESILTSGFGLMGYLPIPSLILAPLLALHLGTEYTENTIRNKLIVGHTRKSIYLADLAVCAAAALFLDVLYLLLAGVLCVYPIMGMAGTLLRVSPGQMLAWVLVGLLARMAYAAFLKFLSTVISGRAVLSIAVLLLLLASALLCSYGFREIEYLTRNLAELNREARLFRWQLVLDTLPIGQYLQISRLDTPYLWRMPLMSLLVIAGSTGAGLAFFRRKDLK